MFELPDYMVTDLGAGWGWDEGVKAVILELRKRLREAQRFNTSPQIRSKVLMDFLNEPEVRGIADSDV